MIEYSTLFPGHADLGAARLNQSFQCLLMRMLFALTKFTPVPVRT